MDQKTHAANQPATQGEVQGLRERIAKLEERIALLEAVIEDSPAPEKNGEQH